MECEYKLENLHEDESQSKQISAQRRLLVDEARKIKIKAVYIRDIIEIYIQ